MALFAPPEFGWWTTPQPVLLSISAAPPVVPQQFGLYVYFAILQNPSELVLVVSSVALAIPCLFDG